MGLLCTCMGTHYNLGLEMYELNEWDKSQTVKIWQQHNNNNKKRNLPIENNMKKVRSKKSV